jgi:hypothetical protein
MSATSNGKLKEMTPEMALELLQSALAYCQRAGMRVEAGNRNLAGKGQVMLIAVQGAQVVRGDDGIRLATLQQPAEVPA